MPLNSRISSCLHPLDSLRSSSALMYGEGLVELLIQGVYKAAVNAAGWLTFLAFFAGALGLPGTSSSPPGSFGVAPRRQLRSTPGGGWSDYLVGVAAVLHYAEHTEANVEDARAYFVHTLRTLTRHGKGASHRPPRPHAG